jgi:anti-sigma28 factor (negative regulator of flagellin synthesis)
MSPGLPETAAPLPDAPFRPGVTNRVTGEKTREHQLAEQNSKNITITEQKKRKAVSNRLLGKAGKKNDRVREVKAKIDSGDFSITVDISDVTANRRRNITNNSKKLEDVLFDLGQGSIDTIALIEQNFRQRPRISAISRENTTAEVITTYIHAHIHVTCTAHVTY